MIDGDAVDVSNLHRQVIHADAAVGEPKALSAVRRMRETNPEVDARAVVGTMVVDNALDLLRGHDLVIDGTDNFPTRYLASDACEMLDLPLVWGSILAYQGQVAVFDADGGRGVTYRDVHPVPPRPGEVPNCAEAGVLGMLCGVIGSTMALEAVKVIAGIGEPLRGRIALYDALAMRWVELPVRRAEERAPVTQLEDLTITCGLPGAMPAGTAVSVGAGQQDAGGSGTLQGTDGKVAPEDVPGLLESGVRVIDIREDHEVVGGMVAGAEHRPMNTLLDAVDDARLDGAVLYCAGGVRSEAARRALAARGIEVGSVTGGFEALCDVPGLTIAPPSA